MAPARGGGRPRRAVTVAAVAVAAVAFLACTACASGADRPSGAGPSTTAPAGGRSTTVPARVLGATTVPGGGGGPGSSAPPDGSVSTTTPQQCGPLTVADVASATGVASAEVRRGTGQLPDAPCVFRADRYVVASAVDTVEATTTEPVTTAATVPGVPGRSSLRVAVDRGGRWSAEAGVLTGNRYVSLTVRNERGGSDTDPPVAGDPQRGPTTAVATALLRAMAARL